MPAGTKLYEIRDIFAKHGELGRVILPPSGITALVEFFEPSEARKAFTRLAYTKFKHLPLYLEWAPDDSFTSELSRDAKGKNFDKINSTSISKEETGEVKTEEESVNDKDKNAEIDDEDEEDDEEPEPETTLFVKNLNFKTTEEQLKKV